MNIVFSYIVRISYSDIVESRIKNLNMIKHFIEILKNLHQYYVF